MANNEDEAVATDDDGDSFVIVQLTPGKIQINCLQNGANNADGTRKNPNLTADGSLGTPRKWPSN